MYDSSEDASLYLGGSIVQYEGEPVKVEQVDEEMIARVELIKGNKVKFVPLDELDLTPIKLGYFLMHNDLAFYTYRIPSRSWRQGLTRNTCRGKLRGKRNNEQFFLDRLNSRQLYRMLKFKYPVINKAYRVAKKMESEVPFSREFTVNEEGIVRYKTELIGEWTGKKFKLLSRYQYLKEMLEEYVNEYFRGM